MSTTADDDNILHTGNHHVLGWHYLFPVSIKAQNTLSMTHIDHNSYFQRGCAQLQEIGREHEWSGSDAFHLQSISALWGLALRHLHVRPRRCHAHHDESDHPDILGCCFGVGASLVACVVGVFGGRSGRLDGHIDHQSAHLFGRRVWRCVRTDYSAYRNHYHGNYQKNVTWNKNLYSDMTCWRWFFWFSQNWSEMEYAIVQLFVFLIFCVTDLGFSMYRHFNDIHDQVGYVAHLSGAVAGLLVGIGVLRNLKVRPWERKLWWCAVTLYFLLMGSGVFFHLFYSDWFPYSQPKRGQFS